jgi:hypothetical protein
MASSVRKWLRCVGSLTALLLLATILLAAEGKGRPAKIGPVNPNAETVEMFAAIEKGDIAVKLIPKDSTECRVLIENKTNKPLNVKLPEAFAGVPVLAQVAGGPVGGHSGRSGGSSRNSNGGGNQGMGGGMGGGGMMGGGMFGVPPEQVGKFKVPTVCLDHGKAEPRAAVPYEIKPIERYTSKPGVRELCQMIGSGQISQRAAQAAAWHLNNDMSWEELTNKRLRRANGTSQPYFSPAEIQAGRQIAATAVHVAKEKGQEKTAPSTTAPSSLKSSGN